MASNNSIAVLNFLKAHYGEEFSKKQIAEALGISVPAVTGSINALVKKGHVATTREEVIELEPATETRKAKTTTVKYHTLNESGLTFDPIAEEEAAKQRKEEEKAQRAAERAARKAAKEAEQEF